MKRFFRTTAIVLAFLFSVCAAAIGGAFLAAYDTDNIHTVYAMIRSEDKAKEKTHKIVKKDGSITDVIDIIDGPGVPDTVTKQDVIPDAINTVITGVPESDDINDSQGDESKAPEEKPIVIGSEISGIAEIVRAADEDNVVINNTHAETIQKEQEAAKVTPTVDPVKSYPLPFTTVDTDYFNDALFIGDSRMQGLGMYSKLPATFYAQTAFQLYKYKTFKVVQTPEGKMPIFDVMPYDRFTKVYIKCGLNEFGISDESFIDVYTQFVNEIRIMQPRAIIYVHAILPVTASKSSTDATHNNTNIARRNAVLKNFAEMMKCYYVDVGPYVSDETGALIADSASDGIHMSGKYMGNWVKGLCEQAVLWPQ